MSYKHLEKVDVFHFRRDVTSFDIERVFSFPSTSLKFQGQLGQINYGLGRIINRTMGCMTGEAANAQIDDSFPLYISGVSRMI